jgi:hypothetical protein
MKRLIPLLQLLYMSFIAYSHDYFPIAVGNEWDFSFRCASIMNSSVLKYKIESDTFVLDKHIYKMSQTYYTDPSNRTDSTKRKITYNYLFSDGDDIYCNDSLSWYDWMRSPFKHAFKDGEKYTYLFSGYYGWVTATYIGSYDRYDSCFNVVPVSDTAHSISYVFAPDIGWIRFGIDTCGYVLEAFIQNNTVIRPVTDRRPLSLIMGKDEEARESAGMFMVNGRTVHMKLFPGNGTNAGYSSNFFIVKSKNRFGAGTIKPKVYLNR